MYGGACGRQFEVKDIIDTIGIFWVEKENNSINKKLEALCTLFREIWMQMCVYKI